MLFALWDDEDGVILSAELVLIGTILILGMIVGLVGLQTAVVAELSDLGNSFGNLDQSYQTSGVTSLKFNGVRASTAGSSFFDSPDSNDCNDCNTIIVCDAVTGIGEHTSALMNYSGTTQFGPTIYQDDSQVAVPPEIQEPAEPAYTEEELKELERIKMERRVYERYKVPELPTIEESADGISELPAQRK